MKSRIEDCHVLNSKEIKTGFQNSKDKTTPWPWQAQVQLMLPLEESLSNPDPQLMLLSTDFQDLARGCTEQTDGPLGKRVFLQEWF